MLLARPGRSDKQEHQTWGDFKIRQLFDPIYEPAKVPNFELYFGGGRARRGEVVEIAASHRLSASARAHVSERGIR